MTDTVEDTNLLLIQFLLYTVPLGLNYGGILE